jgi:hypothetical protein
VQPDDAFLRPTPIIDWDHPDVSALARRLAEGCNGGVPDLEPWQV